MMKSEQKNINWERYTALCSMLVAACALMISIWQSYGMQQHNKLSLRPYLETEFNYAEGGKFELYIHNNGMGPAQVTAVKYKVDGIEQANSSAFLQALGEDPNCYAQGNIGRFYKVADQQLVLQSLQPQCFKTIDAVYAMLNRIQIELEYLSLYDESYQLLISNGGSK
jgi:hypothetical protein